MRNHCFAFRILILSVVLCTLFKPIASKWLGDHELKAITTPTQYAVLSKSRGSFDLQNSKFMGEILTVQWSQDKEVILNCHDPDKSLGIKDGQRCGNGGACAYLKENGFPMNYQEAESYLELEVRRGEVNETRIACYCSLPHVGIRCELVSPCARNMTWLDQEYFALGKDREDKDANIAPVSLDECKEKCLLRADFSCRSLDYDKHGKERRCYLSKDSRTEKTQEFLAHPFLSYHEPQRSTYCGVGGECRATYSSPYFHCMCHAGYTGARCEEYVLQCEAGVCGHGGTCVNLQPGYKCSCTDAWTGKNCERAIDYCEQYEPCGENGNCENIAPGDKDIYSQVGYRCRCHTGWRGLNCTKTWNSGWNVADVLGLDAYDENSQRLAAEEEGSSAIAENKDVLIAVGVCVLVVAASSALVIWLRLRKLQVTRDRQMLKRMETQSLIKRKKGTSCKRRMSQYNEMLQYEEM